MAIARAGRKPKKTAVADVKGLRRNRRAAKLTKAYREALARQAATADILKAIARSPSDAQPVFETIARSAHKLCNARYAVVTQRVNDMLHLVAHTASTGVAHLEKLFAARLTGQDATGKAVLTRKPAWISDTETDPDYPDAFRAGARERGYRSQLTVPILRHGESIGAITVTRQRAGEFARSEIELLQSFAAQAVIAIENVRLFNEAKQALERQIATADILRVISSSPTNVQPVFQAIVQNAVRLCGARFGRVYRYENSLIQLVASHGLSGSSRQQMQRVFPRPADRQTIVGQVILERRVRHVHDLDADEDVPALSREMMQVMGTRSQVTLPLLRGDEPIGAITMGWDAPDGFREEQVRLLEIFADQAVIAIENVHLFNETKEALERQTATADVLRVISASPTDVNPVFDAILQSAVRLCDAQLAAAFRYDGRLVHMTATHNWPPEALEYFSKIYPCAPNPSLISGRVILERAIVIVADAAADPHYDPTSAATGQWRRMVGVPMLREGNPLGLLVVSWREPGDTPARQIELLKTFADQAAIAIGNVRLFNETREALEQQTATAEILKAISSSPTDVQPVFEAIVRSGVRLFENAAVAVARPDGNQFRLMAIAEHDPALAEKWKAAFPFPVDRRFMHGAAILDRGMVEMEDALVDDGRFTEGKRNFAATGYRAMTVVPMMKDGAAIGTISVVRVAAGPLSDKQKSLLRTFADQAVIAIENVRLFNETNEALERQTATADVLAAISGAQTEVDPVFEAIARNAQRLCGAVVCNVLRYDGALLHIAASHGFSPEQDKKLREKYPVTAGDRSVISGRVIASRRIEHIQDVMADSQYDQPHAVTVAGWRRMLGVPMLRDEEVLGVIVVAWRDPGITPDSQVDLLRTFAAQAAIAIENVRLFNQTKESLEQQVAISEVLRVISFSPTDVRPVLDAVAQRAARICDASDSHIFLADADRLVLTCGFGDLALTMSMGDSLPLNRASVTGRAVIDRAPVHVEDLVQVPRAELGVTLALQEKIGHRTMLAVPLMREDRALGAIVLRRMTVKPFNEKQIALLRVFADQAAIAIENVRLFNETKEALEQQKASAEVLAAISGSIADTKPVFDKILQSCERLFAGSIVGINVIGEDGLLRVGAYQGAGRENLEKIFPRPVRADSGSGLCIIERRVIHYPDTEHGAGVPDATRRGCAAIGVKSVLFAPMLWEERALGAIFVGRDRAVAFSEREAALLRTFADQAVIAIRNTQLVREIQEKSSQLEEASRHKSQFLASMSHELRTPLNAILGFNEMILGGIYGDVPADMTEPLTDIQTSGKHLLRLINNVLDLAKIEAGRMELALADYSVHDTVAGVQATLRPLAAEKGLGFAVRVPADIPLARGDAGRLTQCLMNLAGNSLKFTKSGRVEIAVAQEKGLLRYTVSDTGIGIAPDKIASLFTEFKQTDATIASEYGGTGLGLSITRKFIEMHGGSVWVESEPGKGSSFTFEIPLRVGE